MLIVTRQFQAAFVLFPLSNQSQIKKVSIVARSVWSGRRCYGVLSILVSRRLAPDTQMAPDTQTTVVVPHTELGVSKQTSGRMEISVKDTYSANCPPLWISFTSNVQTAFQFRNAWWTFWSTFHIKLSQVTICGPAHDVWRSSPIWIFIT